MEDVVSQHNDTGCGHVAHFYSAGLQWGRTADGEDVRCLTADASLFALPADEVMPGDGRRRLEAARKDPGVRAVWRHKPDGCNRPVAVVVDMDSGAFVLDTYLGRRVMLGREREGATLRVDENPERVVTAITPGPVAVRCCGPVWFLDWARMWKAADTARTLGRVEDLGTRP